MIAFAAGLPEVDPARLAIWGFSLSAYGSRGGVEPLAGLAVRLRAPGAEVRVCAPPDCAERLAEVGVPMVPAGAPDGARATPPPTADLHRQSGTVAAAAEGRDALIATGAMSAAVWL